MIVKAEIINQPYSGEFTERIYDNKSAWNSQDWCFIKFTNDDYWEWCGQFRGLPEHVALSTKHNSILILTSDYLYQLDRNSGNLTAIDDRLTYHSLSVSPSGDFIIADNSNIEKITTNIRKKKPISSPIEMDFIKFQHWEGSKILFTCNEFLNWERHLVMTYDCETDRVEIINEK